MVGRIVTQHRGLVGLIRIGEPVGDLPSALLGIAGVVPVVGGEPPSRRTAERVGVPEEEPAADGTATVDRVALAEALVEWIRPLACLTEEGIEKGLNTYSVSRRSATMAPPMRASSRPMRSDRASVLTWRSLYPRPGAGGNVRRRRLASNDRRSAVPAARARAAVSPDRPQDDVHRSSRGWQPLATGVATDNPVSGVSRAQSLAESGGAPPRYHASTEKDPDVPDPLRLDVQFTGRGVSVAPYRQSDGRSLRYHPGIRQALAIR